MRPRTPTAIAAAVVAVSVVVSASGCGGRAERAADRQLGVTSAPRPTTIPARAAVDATTTTAPTISGAAPCTPPTTTLTAGRFAVDVDGTSRDYLLEVPTDLDPTQPTPVILNFHGSGSDMDQQAAYSQLPERGATRGYVVVTPQGSGTPRGWALQGAGTDDAFVEALLAAVGTGVCVDADAVFAAGISNGSAFSALYACRHPDRIAAVGMVAATLPSLCPVDDPMPAMAFHGTGDQVVPYGGGTVNSERSGTEAPGAESAIAQWAQRNGCAAEPAEAPIGADVTERAWSGCTDGADVTFFSIRGGGHTWPGAIDVAALGITRLGATTQSVSATDRLLDFFDQVARNNG